MEVQEEAKLESFLQWLQVNQFELRGCKIRYCNSKKGFGIFSSGDNCEGILLVAPLDVAITPMRVLQDPTLGPTCRKLFEAENVDDRFLMILFLTVERACKNSSWKPYLDMLPSTFGTPLWFSDDELLELNGTALHKATELQKKSLKALFDDKVKHLAEELIILHGESESLFFCYLPLKPCRIYCLPHHMLIGIMPRSVLKTLLLLMNREKSSSHCMEKVTTMMVLVRPKMHQSSWLNKNMILTQGFFEKRNTYRIALCVLKNSYGEHENCSLRPTQISGEKLMSDKDESSACFSGCKSSGVESPPTTMQAETAWVEGLVPGIDFCNHNFKAAATWEVDETGCTTGVPMSMYLLSAEENTIPVEAEIHISYGNKGNEELLYLYGFVVDNNPDDYLMVHCPIETFQKVPCADSKAQFLEIQEAEMRCLLPRNLLLHGFFSGPSHQSEDMVKCPNGEICNYSWSGKRKVPSYLNKLVFPENFLTALRTIAMQEDELDQVISLLEELVGSSEERQPSATEVQAAVWEVCGDAGALQLLVDLLNAKMMELEEGSGTEACDSEILGKACILEDTEVSGEFASRNKECGSEKLMMSRNRWSCIVYRRGQKQLTRLFLREAEHALQLCLNEQ